MKTKNSWYDPVLIKPEIRNFVNGQRKLIPDFVRLSIIKWDRYPMNNAILAVGLIKYKILEIMIAANNE